MREKLQLTRISSCKETSGRTVCKDGLGERVPPSPSPPDNEDHLDCAETETDVRVLHQCIVDRQTAAEIASKKEKKKK
jgi:hypothetical protein